MCLLYFSASSQDGGPGRGGATRRGNQPTEEETGQNQSERGCLVG